MKLSPRDKVIVLALGIVIVLVALVVLLVVPQIQKINDIGGQIEVAKQESQAATSLLQQRRAIRDEAAVTDASLIQLANAVPENPELPSLVIELQDAAYESEVLLRMVSPQQPLVPEGVTGWVEVPLDIEIYGTWDNTVDYLGRIDRLSRELRTVEFAAIVLDEKLAGDAKMDMKTPYYVRTVIKLTSYVIPAPDAATAPVAPPAP